MPWVSAVATAPVPYRVAASVECGNYAPVLYSVRANLELITRSHEAFCTDPLGDKVKTAQCC